tara:strand:+ start:1376 stop:1762 length:387 start_codon:yes stop_codon:yes gene_type:complete
MSGYKSSEEDMLGIPPVPEGGVDCAYPSCRKGKITGETPYVSWHGNLDLEHLYTTLPAVAKLVIQEHKDDFMQKHNRVTWLYLVHAECAAEWGMHLIKDAMKAEGNVGRVLTERHRSAYPKRKTNEKT